MLILLVGRHRNGFFWVDWTLFGTSHFSRLHQNKTILCPIVHLLLSAFTVINTTTTGLAWLSKKVKEMSKIVFCEFEVFGKVQGVYFRKYTERQAIILGLRGKYYSITVLFIHVKSKIKLNSIFGCPRHCQVSLAIPNCFFD